MLKNINSETAQRWDDISLRMIQICLKTVVEPLRILFLPSLENAVYLSDWTRSNIVAIHKIIYQLVSFLFERITFKSLFNYFLENKLFTECQ